MPVIEHDVQHGEDDRRRQKHEPLGSGERATGQQRNGDDDREDQQERIFLHGDAGERCEPELQPLPPQPGVQHPRDEPRVNTSA